jgi:hypothetical protein
MHVGARGDLIIAERLGKRTDGTEKRGVKSAAPGLLTGVVVVDVNLL